MKYLLFLILFSTSAYTWGQNPEDKVGDIEVIMIGHGLKENRNFERTNRKTNKANRPGARMFFDKDGVLLKTITYGKYHNTDLRLIGEMSLYQYDNNGQKSRIDIWESNYENKLEHIYYELFERDSTGINITAEKTYSADTDSLYIQKNYWFNEKGQYQGEKMSASYYYKRTYNEQGELTGLQQIFKDKLRWEWKYTYTENQRVGIFQTYYKDGDDYSKKEVRTYNKEGFIAEIEETHLSKSGLSEKMKIHYGKNGIIKRIEAYELYSTDKGYEKVYYRDIKVKTRVKITPEIAERINAKVFGDLE